MKENFTASEAKCIYKHLKRNHSGVSTYAAQFSPSIPMAAQSIARP